MTIEALFEPLPINSKAVLPNRLVMAPMTTTAGEDDGSVSAQEIEYLADRAARGIGTIITPACYCHKSGHSFPGQIGAHSDSMLPSLSRCASAIRENGGIAVLQIHHGGNAAKQALSGQPPLAPSAVVNRRGTSETPRAMTEEEIDMIVQAFAHAAARAERAGFDGVEIHGANTYLFQQFFSPFTNKRDDQYGPQSYDNRCRFAERVVKRIRDEVSSDLMIWYRVSPEEPEPDGYRTEEVLQLLQRIVPLGIDVIHVSSWSYGTSIYPVPGFGTNPTRLIKDKVTVPVVGVGNIRTPERATRVLEDGIDLVALGRVLLYDPDWAIKAGDGKDAEIRTTVTSLEEIDRLSVPDKMKTYLRKFYPDNI